MIEQQDSQHMNLSVYRSLRRGKFSEGNVELLNRLNPHLERALHLHLELAEARKMRGVLEAVSTPYRPM